MPISARHGKRQRHPPLPRPVEHPAVARFQPVVAQGQAPQPVAFVRVGARQVQHQAGLKALLQSLQCMFQRIQVLRVATSIRQRHIQVAVFLAERKVALAVQ